MKKRLSIFLMIFTAFLFVCGVFSGCGRDQDSPKQGAQVRGQKEQGGPFDFVLQDLHGRTFRMQDYQGRVVLLIFGTTWCPSCRSEIPHFKDIYTKYSSRGLEVVYVNIQEPKDKVTRFSAKYQLPYRVLLDMTGDVASAYGVAGVPAMALVKGGQVLTQDYRLIDAYLEKLFPK